MAFIETISWHSIVNMLSEAKESIHISMPSIDEELAELLVNIKNKKIVSVNVCLDNSEDAIRNGYGEAIGIEKLLQADVLIKEIKGNRVSFIIADNRSYIVFCESRIFSAEPAGPNAIEIDACTATRLITHYFPAESNLEKLALQQRLIQGIEQQKDFIENLTTEIEEGVQEITRGFKKKSFDAIHAALIKDPPIQPDLQRKMKTYNAKVQLAELKFSGGRIQNMLVEFPKKGLPIQDDILKDLLQSKIKLINNDDFLRENITIKDLQTEVEELRKKYLIPLTCREGKSVLKKVNKDEFLKAFEIIVAKMKEINKSLPGMLIKAIEKTKELVMANLLNFFDTYPTKEQQKYPDLEVKKYQIKVDVEKIISSIRFPTLSKMAEHFSLKVNFYDLTWDDFKDKELLEEFKKKEILSSFEIAEIVDMEDVLKAKK